MSGTSKALVFNLGKKKAIMGGRNMKRPKITNKTDEPEIRKGIHPFTQPSISTGNRLLRLLWIFSSFVLFRIIPRPLHLWRNSVLRLLGAIIVRRFQIYASVSIWVPWNFETDDNASMWSGVICYSMARVHLYNKSNQTSVELISKNLAFRRRIKRGRLRPMVK